MAGAGLKLEPDVVIYMGRAAQGMPQDEAMDQRIADGFTNAVLKTLEYIPERDGPAIPKILGPYNPDTDKSEVVPLGGGLREQQPREVLHGFGDMNEYGLPKGMSAGDQSEVMSKYPLGSFSSGDMAHGGSTPYKPMDAESLRRLNAPGTPMPESIKEMILKQMGKKV